MANAYAAEVSKWDKESATWSEKDSFSEIVAKRIMEKCGDMSQLRVLDFGCGVGTLAKILSSKCKSVVAVDISPGMVSEAKKKLDSVENATVMCVNVTADVIAEMKWTNAFDVVVTGSVLHCTEDALASMHMLMTTVKPGGGQVFHYIWEDAEYDEFKRHEGVSRAYFENAMNETTINVAIDSFYFVRGIMLEGYGQRA